MRKTSIGAAAAATVAVTGLAFAQERQCGQEQAARAVSLRSRAGRSSEITRSYPSRAVDFFLRLGRLYLAIQNRISLYSSRKKTFANVRVSTGF